MDVCLSVLSVAFGTSPIPVGCGIIDALFTEHVGACFKNHFLFPLGPALAHDFGFKVI